MNTIGGHLDPRGQWNAWRYRHIDKFIFIHINKTGGSSIEHALQIPFEHKTAQEKIIELDRTRWDARFTFTVVRNPWDKVVSHFHYRVQTNQIRPASDKIDFTEWVRLAYGEQDPRYYDAHRLFMPQLDWITDQNGNILVDEVYRFENLSNDFSEICSKLARNAELPHFKASKRRRSYRDYYNEIAVDIVADWFRKDIEQFGYQF